MKLRSRLCGIVSGLCGSFAESLCDLCIAFRSRIMWSSRRLLPSQQHPLRCLVSSPCQLDHNAASCFLFPTETCREFWSGVRTSTHRCRSAAGLGPVIKSLLMQQLTCAPCMHLSMLFRRKQVRTHQYNSHFMVSTLAFLPRNQVKQLAAW